MAGSSDKRIALDTESARDIGALVFDDGFETIVAFPAAPNMMDLSLIPILGPFGGDQLISALNAVHPEAGTTIGYYRHWNLTRFRFHERWCKEVTE
jgi:hypothetical protein